MEQGKQVAFCPSQPIYVSMHNCIKARGKNLPDHQDDKPKVVFLPLALSPRSPQPLDAPLNPAGTSTIRGSGRPLAWHPHCPVTSAPRSPETLSALVQGLRQGKGGAQRPCVASCFLGLPDMSTTCPASRISSGPLGALSGGRVLASRQGKVTSPGEPAFTPQSYSPSFLH